MNVENARKLIEFMRQQEAAKTFKFDMNPIIQRHSSCGAAGCLIGEEVVRAFGIEEAFNLYESELPILWNHARDSLGLTEDQATQLFQPEPDENWDDGYPYEESPWSEVTDQPYKATVEQGIQALENAIKMWGGE